MITIVLMFIFIFLITLRLIRWLAIVQLKKYHLSKIARFLFTPQGKLELIKLIPDLSRSGLKLPKITNQNLIVGFISLYLIIPAFFLILSFTKISLISIFIVLYLIIPLIVIIACLPYNLKFIRQKIRKL